MYDQFKKLNIKILINNFLIQGERGLCGSYEEIFINDLIDLNMIKYNINDKLYIPLYDKLHNELYYNLYNKLYNKLYNQLYNQLCTQLSNNL